MAYTYHSYGALQGLAEQIVDKVVSATMDYADSLAEAQQRANNDATRAQGGIEALSVAGYQARGRFSASCRSALTTRPLAASACQRS